jgi:hypothetical protein
LQLGIHAPVQGFTPRGRAAANALRAEAFLWLPSERPQDAYDYPDALHIVRLPNWTHQQTPIEYANACAPLVNQWQHLDRVIYQCGNEPDLESGHHGERFPAYAAALRARWPTILLTNPPLQAEHTYLLSAATCQAADYLACHCYWQVNHSEDISNPNLGMAYDQLLDYGLPVLVTEVNAVPASGHGNDSDVPWAIRNEQVGRWAAIAAGDGVAACCIFVADAAPDWQGFDVGPEAAHDIRAAYESHGGNLPEPPEPPKLPETPDGGEEIDVVVNASAVVAMAETQVGHAHSGDFDRHNGNHPWPYWCLALVESSHRNLGLHVPAQVSAYRAGLSFDLEQGPPPVGAAVFFNQEFYWPDGHVGISVGGGRLLGTLTDGSGVGYMFWNEHTRGFMGWTYYPGVVADRIEGERAPDRWLVQDNNPYQESQPEVIGIGGGFLRYYNSLSIGAEPLVVLGYAMARETQAFVTDDDGAGQRRERTIQRFQRATLIYQPEQPFPHDVVAALFNQTITDL